MMKSASRADQPRLGERRVADHEARPQAEDAGHPVGLLDDDGAHLEGRLADPHAPTEADAETAQQVGVGHRAPGAILHPKRLAEGQRRVENEVANHGIEGVHRL